MATGSWVAKDAGRSLSGGLSPTAFNPAGLVLQSIIAASAAKKVMGVRDYRYKQT